MNNNNVAKIEKELGLDKIKPIQISDSDRQQAELTKDYFQKWYEEELSNLNKS